MDKLDCGHDPTPTESGLGSGYATLRDSNKTVCYPCADDMQREELAATNGPFFAYLSSDNKQVITWSGGELAKVIGHSVSKRARKTYVQARTPDGRKWYGTGPSESGTYVSIRAYKNQ